MILLVKSERWKAGKRQGVADKRRLTEPEAHDENGDTDKSDFFRTVEFFLHTNYIGGDDTGAQRHDEARESYAKISSCR